MKLVYDEWYGELSYAQRAAYKKYNVSPSDHMDLIRNFDESDHAGITAYVKENAAANGGYFSSWNMTREGLEVGWL